MKFEYIKNGMIKKLPVKEESKKIIHRRLNKLVNDPKGFLKNSYKKRSEQIISKNPIKNKSSNDFTVVSAVYNVDKYLDDYFNSLVKQTISFKKNIQLILVDDGSTDNSAEIIKKWQRRYPKNITYIYKENGGQSSARNLGINYVETDWVTFIDPDDFVSKNYFMSMDKVLSKEKNILMLVGNIVYYDEVSNKNKDTHPLRFRFKNREPISVFNLENNINLSAASTFFSADYIKKASLVFNESLKPTFEDGKFIADYLLGLNMEKVFFQKDSYYFYRKREDNTSTLDTSWSKKEKFSDVLKYGHISMLKEYRSKIGFVPNNIQRTALYDMSWYVKYLINHPERIEFLSEIEKKEFLEAFLEVFEYIDRNIILDFSMAGIWFFHKVGMLGFCKNEEPESQILYIENIDKVKKQILISYFSYFDNLQSFRLDNKDVIPKYIKNTSHNFVDKIFVQEKRQWIPFEDDNSLLTVMLNGKPARITLNNKQYREGVYIRDVIKGYQPSSKYHTDDSWLLMDRDTQADDNAEHMYRYLKQNYPEQLCYFALRKESHDWARLELEGFNLIDFGTESFEYHLRKSSKIISSHLDKYINNYFGDEYEYSKDFIFLQHGVTKDNLSAWFNTKKNLQCIITSTKPEYQSLVENNGPYKLTEKDVVLTGFPRHDELLANNIFDNKVVLIMPTWRQGIMGNVIGNGNTRVINEGFMETNYAKHWYNLLHSQRLEKLVEKYDYKIIFAPHANIEPYIAMFDVPCHIDIWQARTATTSMQQLFQQAKLMITDYSSVAFEMGLLSKTVIYYQFDRDEAFSGGHTYQQGYFSYENDGFGPVVTEEAELLLELEGILNNNGAPTQRYITRIENTFAYRDTNNCKRVYEAILDLDRPDTSEVSVATIMEYAQQAITHEAWDLALERIENALQHSDITQAQLEVINRNKEQVIQTGYQHDPVKLANILWHEKRLDEGLEKLKQVQSTEVTDELLRLRVKLAILSNDFILARDSQKMLLEEYSDNCTIEDWQFYTQLANI